ncbi:MAG: hypothetical protein KF802_08410 [Bdellovibrionaceae bacterium]|nr:hypothetical protein [Pseudobdellovibrionaceae bacterium]MBX3034955.1 hypothetical protein [Pseudobdellovibrionaceae bacterium]
MTENDIRSIALFYYFALLDEQKAIEAGAEALNYARDRKKRDPALKNSSAVVMATFHVWEKWAGGLNRNRVVPMSSWAMPEGFDLRPWKEFQRNATSEELLVVIWSKIVGYSEGDIAVGLGQTEGTISFRLGKALRKLGGLTSFHPKLI